MRVPHWALGTVLCLLQVSCMVNAFSFTAGTPTSCDNITVSWSGGIAPYQLLISPVFGTPRNISIPSSAFNNGQGNYATQLQFSQNQKFLLTMSDAKGFGTGGSTELLNVGASLGGSCNTTDPGVAFSFQLNDALQQCRTFTFSDYTGAVQPVTITGIIPGGQSFVVSPPTGPTSYDWTANIWNGTSVLFLMADSQGRQGGSSDVRTVGISDDSTCINGQSPSSTLSPTPSTTGSSPPSSSSSSSSSSTPIGAIAGTVLGALVFLAVLITLGLFCLRRRQERHNSSGWTASSFALKRSSRRATANVNLFDELNYRADAHSDPFLSHSDLAARSRSASEDPFNPYSSSPLVTPFTTTHSETHQTQSSISSRKAALAGSSISKPSRFILHTDAEDPLPGPVEEEVIELPPQYSERRAPLQTMNSAPSSSTPNKFPPDHNVP